MKHRTTNGRLLAFALAAAAAFSPRCEAMERLSLDGLWDFSFTERARLDSAAEAEFAPSGLMPVPGCFDLMPGFYARRGLARYRRSFTLRRDVACAYLDIEGMGLSGRFWIDGREVGTSRLPFSRIELPLGPLAAGLVDAMFATSNVWGTTVSVYESSVFPLVDAVSTNVSCSGSIVEWYQRLSAYADEPGSPDTGAWAWEKGRLMHKFARLHPIASSTNAWLSAAECLCRMRNRLLTLGGDSVGQELADLSSRQPSEWDAIVWSRTEDIRSRRQVRTAFEKAANLVGDIVTNGFPRSILPSLDVSMQAIVVSNVAEKAGIGLLGTFGEAPLESR